MTETRFHLIPDLFPSRPYCSASFNRNDEHKSSQASKQINTPLQSPFCDTSSECIYQCYTKETKKSVCFLIALHEF